MQLKFLIAEMNQLGDLISSSKLEISLAICSGCYHFCETGKVGQSFIVGLSTFALAKSIDMIPSKSIRLTAKLASPILMHNYGSEIWRVI